MSRLNGLEKRSSSYYYFPKHGNPVNINKKIQLVEKVETPYGLCKRVTYVTVSESSINALLKNGVIKKKEVTVS